MTIGGGRLWGYGIPGRALPWPSPHAYGPLGHRHGAQLLSEVIIHEDENFERALKRFKKKCEKAGILSDLRKHRHYEKPSERRKRKMNAAVRKNRRTRHG